MANAAALNPAISHAPSPLPVADAGAHPTFSYAMLTDTGRVRHGNQDACASDPEHAAFVVCDGVGGAAGGEIASQLAAETFLSAIRSSSAQIAGEEDASPSPHARLHQAVTAANAMVFERAQKSRALHGMATTLVAALLEYPAAQNSGVPHSLHDGSRAMSGKESCPTLWLAHAGDSRAYRFRRAATGDSAEPTELTQLTQLTTDHSLVEEQIRAGLVSRLDALHSPVRNVITRAVGAAPIVEPDIASHEIRPGDLYLLASDGLTRELDDAEIAQILTATLGLDHAASFPTLTSIALESAASALIHAANHHGGRDNITVLLLACR